MSNLWEIACNLPFTSLYGQPMAGHKCEALSRAKMQHLTFVNIRKDMSEAKYVVKVFHVKDLKFVSHWNQGYILNNLQLLHNKLLKIQYA